MPRLGHFIVCRVLCSEFRNGADVIRVYFYYKLTLVVVHDKMKTMKKVIIAFMFLVAALPAYAYVDHDTAVISIMNKAAGKVQSVTVPVGTMIEFEKLNIMVRSCKQTDPFQAQDYFMFVEVSTAADGKIFSNWMSHNEPGERPLQNSDYDLWLVRCE